MLKSLFFAFVFVLFGNLSARASEQLELGSFRDVVQKVEDVGARWGNDNVLAVFDIDDTLLVLNQDLGGEAWYEWQVSEIQCEDKCTPEMKTGAGSKVVAPNVTGILNFMGEIMSLTHAHPTEPEIPADLKVLQQRGVKTVVLTARGFSKRDATLRQFAENGMTFSSVGLNGNKIGVEYIPVLTPEESHKFNITSVRPVNYTQGIINTDGQHKGVMLAAWLRQLNQNPKAIVFVDNESKQTNRVFSVFNSSKIDITTIRYSHEDLTRDRFWTSQKEKSISDWETFSQLSSAVFK